MNYITTKKNWWNKVCCKIELGKQWLSKKFWTTILLLHCKQSWLGLLGFVVQQFLKGHRFSNLEHHTQIHIMYTKDPLVYIMNSNPVRQVRLKEWLVKVHYATLVFISRFWNVPYIRQLFNLSNNWIYVFSLWSLNGPRRL